MKRIGDHRAFVPRDVRPSGIAEIENASRIGCGLRAGEVACYKTSEVFRQRDAEITRAPTSPSLYLGFERNLGASHHDGTIIT